VGEKARTSHRFAPSAQPASRSRQHLGDQTGGAFVVGQPTTKYRKSSDGSKPAENLHAALEVDLVALTSSRDSAQPGTRWARSAT
jgi:hypothetical protein